MWGLYGGGFFVQGQVGVEPGGACVRGMGGFVAYVCGNK